MNTYTIQDGDTLFDISENVLGDGNRFREFAQWNAWLTDPDHQVIRPGQKLSYPATKTPASVPQTATNAPGLLSRLFANKLLLLALVAGVLGVAAWKMGYLDRFGLKSNPRKSGGKRARKTNRKTRWSKGSDVQSILFPAAAWSEDEAEEWLESHGFKTPAVDVTKGYLRYRQAAPTRFVSRHFRTRVFGKHDGKTIKAVVGEPK